MLLFHYLREQSNLVTNKNSFFAYFYVLWYYVLFYSPVQEEPVLLLLFATPATVLQSRSGLFEVDSALSLWVVDFLTLQNGQPTSLKQTLTCKL